MVTLPLLCLWGLIYSPGGRGIFFVVSIAHLLISAPYDQVHSSGAVPLDFVDFMLWHECDHYSSMRSRYLDSSRDKSLFLIVNKGIILRSNYFISRPTSDNARFMPPVIVNKFPTHDLASRSARSGEGKNYHM